MRTLSYVREKPNVARAAEERGPLLDPLPLLPRQEVAGWKDPARFMLLLEDEGRAAAAARS